MIPGPTEGSPEVLRVLSLPYPPHYGPDWKVFYEETIELLRKVFRTEEEIIMLNAGGNAAIDMAVANIVAPGDKVVVVLNGFFGEILEESVRLHGGQVIPAEAEYGRAVDPERVRALLEEHKDVRAILAVHNETSTGIVNPISELGELAHEYGAYFVVDAVSGFGGVELDVDRWHIDFCIGYSSKCLAGANGITPIAISRRVWERAQERRGEIRARYLNLNIWRRVIDEWSSWGHPYPGSMPSNVIMALRKALELALEEGLERRYRRHRVAAKACREGMKALGMQLMPLEAEASPTVSVARAEDGLDHKIRSLLLERYNIMIGGGISKLAGKIIRIGHMGLTASRPYILPTLSALGQILAELGLTDNPGAGVAAAEEVFASEGF
jgi:aspartate aminotransferase-like enzyme